MPMEVMERNRADVNGHDVLDGNDTRDTLFLLSGAALMLFGAGLVLTTPAVRRYLGSASVGNLLTAAVPDFERYLKLRSM